MPIRAKIDLHSQNTPDKIAFQLDDWTINYKDLAERSQSFSDYVLSLPGNRASCSYLNQTHKLVALDVGNHPLFPELFVGATSNPIACAILDPGMSLKQVTDILEKLQPDLIVTTGPDTATSQATSHLDLTVLTTDAISDGICTEAKNKPSTPPPKNDGPFLVSFTSGTTSLPKACFRSRTSWYASMARGKDYFGFDANQTMMSPGGLSHGLAYYVMVEAFYAGATFRAVPKWDVHHVKDILKSGNVQRFVGVPTMISALAKAFPGTSMAFPGVQEILTAGAKFTRSNLEQATQLFPAARIREYYGAAELGFISVATVHPADPETPPESVGCPFPGVEVSIQGTDGQSLPDNEPGLIYVKSDLISDGYLWGDDGKSFRLNDTGAATVGDIGELNEAGVLKVVGREGGMIITGGFNVYPSEVETILKNLVGIEDAVVLGLDDPHLGKRIVAVISGNITESTDTLAEMTSRLPRYKVPRAIYKIHDWPMTISGKIARREIEKALLNDELTQI